MLFLGIEIQTVPKTLFFFFATNFFIRDRQIHPQKYVCFLGQKRTVIKKKLRHFWDGIFPSPKKKNFLGHIRPLKSFHSIFKTSVRTICTCFRNAKTNIYVLTKISEPKTTSFFLKNIHLNDKHFLGHVWHPQKIETILTRSNPIFSPTTINARPVVINFIIFYFRSNLVSQLF